MPVDISRQSQLTVRNSAGKSQSLTPLRCVWRGAVLRVPLDTADIRFLLPPKVKANSSHAFFDLFKLVEVIRFTQEISRFVFFYDTHSHLLLNFH